MVNARNVVLGKRSSVCRGTAVGEDRQHSMFGSCRKLGMARAKW